MEKVYRTELTPLMFLERAAEVYPDKVAIVHGDRRVTYREFAQEATRLAHALRASGIEPGDRVGYLCPNIPEMLVAHFGVALAGGILVAINTRLAAEEMRYICDHSGAKLVVADTELQQELEKVAGKLETVREIVGVDDADIEAPIEGPTYQELLDRGSDEPLPWRVDDEYSMISINYTSGTTGQPKGVMYHHRGAYLNALGEIITSRHTPQSVYLWTLPMFHCNGWCTTWAVTAIGGTHVCLRAVRGPRVWELIRQEGVTHLNGAPTVLNTMINADEAGPIDGGLIATTAGAAPSPTLIGELENLNVKVVHVYGLTETYGPHTVCERQPEWENLEVEERAELLARQGVAMIMADPIRVVDDDGNDVPRDGETVGEIVMRGNNVMKGYFEDPEETDEAFKHGFFHSGDLGVMHPDGYIEVKDREKDIIISGGENISTIEVENAIVKHSAVDEVAVIGVESEEWGERPKAFVVLKKDEQVDAEGMKEHLTDLIAKYKIPDQFEFVDELPKTSTGKIQKFVLREEWEDQAAEG